MANEIHFSDGEFFVKFPWVRRSGSVCRDSKDIGRHILDELGCKPSPSVIRLRYIDDYDTKIVVDWFCVREDDGEVWLASNFPDLIPPAHFVPSDGLERDGGVWFLSVDRAVEYIQGKLRPATVHNPSPNPGLSGKVKELRTSEFSKYR